MPCSSPSEVLHNNLLRAAQLVRRCAGTAERVMDDGDLEGADAALYAADRAQKRGSSDDAVLDALEAAEAEYAAHHKPGTCILFRLLWAQILIAVPKDHSLGGCASNQHSCGQICMHRRRLIHDCFMHPAELGSKLSGRVEDALNGGPSSPRGNGLPRTGSGQKSGGANVDEATRQRVRARICAALRKNPNVGEAGGRAEGIAVACEEKCFLSCSSR